MWIGTRNSIYLNIHQVENEERCMLSNFQTNTCDCERDAYNYGIDMG